VASGVLHDSEHASMSSWDDPGARTKNSTSRCGAGSKNPVLVPHVRYGPLSRPPEATGSQPKNSFGETGSAKVTTVGAGVFCARAGAARTTAATSAASSSLIPAPASL
jgi:hypothetical protein